MRTQTAPLARFKALAGGALDLLYPQRCAGCGAFRTLLCARCAAKMTSAKGEGRCKNCAAAWPAADYCPRCLHWSSIDRCLAAYEMTGPARDLTHLLKFGGVRAAAGIMGAAMADLRKVEAFDIAIPAPIHARRRRKRGFNQAELIARATGWPVGLNLLKVSHTRPQVGLGLKERIANVRDAFGYDGPPLTGQTVAVIDDVVTTGATVDECARVLKLHGAARVIAVAFARTSYLGNPPSDA